MPFTVTTHGPDQTFLTGIALGKLAQAGDTLLLQGPLGTGKTRLTQGLTKGMGITASVTSPTFIIVNQYPGPLTLYHIDLYRIENAAEAADLGLDDYFFDEGVCVVEWPDRAPAAMPPDHLLVELKHTGEQQRSLTFKAVGERYVNFLRLFQGALPPSLHATPAGRQGRGPRRGNERSSRARAAAADGAS